ncbi:transcription factor C subunit 7 [Sporothrix schenckii 1099-18]|uniref:Transcription factor C subunit 7 n=1 Tax=Sporothrix schenckii 1099-18 TaxID=1397361 RepID=A0A0F2ME67_SPOSC|nr:transcription factor C subunit 7 [Sporothrix schenckii 1099-18]KJR86431.1 transcription factor C subunit 7 [Sporothrix schenckii 1099-18]
MPLEYIYVARHGFRSNWVVNPKTGDYTAFVPSPTGIPADPALTSHGVDQSRELGAHLASSAMPVPAERIYSSPYYRCLQTIQPFVEIVAGKPTPTYYGHGHGQGPLPPPPRWAVRCDSGLVDWFGPAPFDQPQPAPLKELHDDFFPWIDLGYESRGQGSGVVPLRNGESMAQLHARVAATLGHIVRQCDAEGVRAIVVCSHAATIIAMGRVLTGQVPDDVETEDFGAFTCGLSVFRRRTLQSQSEQQQQKQKQQRQQPQQQQQLPGQQHRQYPHPQHRNVSSLQSLQSRHPLPPPSPSTLRGHVPPWDDQFHTLAGEAWIGGQGVGGGWDCVVNCDCSFLSEGEERGWWVAPFPSPSVLPMLFLRFFIRSGAVSVLPFFLACLSLPLFLPFVRALLVYQL